jgi:hypothetical protein
MTTHPPDPPASAFYAAMREQILATPMPPRARTLAWLQRQRSRRARFGVLSGATAAVAAVIVALVLTLGATTDAPPAYAIVRNADGSLTITLNDLTTGIPALNARFQQLGIPENVIPIYAGCNSPDGSGNLVMHPDPLFEIKGSITMTYTPRAAQLHPAPAGYQYVLAAKRLPNGMVLDFIGALKPPIPTCLPYNSTPATGLP